VLTNRGTVEIVEVTGCPRCGNQDLKIWVKPYVNVDGDPVGTGAADDSDWEANPHVKCNTCDFAGNLAEFVVPDVQKKEKT